MMDPRRYSVDSMPAGDRDEALRLKADALHDLACRIQDQLNEVGIFHGDPRLLPAKQAIDDACTRAREVSDRIRHDDKYRARIVALLSPEAA